MLLKTLRYTAIILIITSIFASCVTDDPSSHSTRLRINLTDAPTELEAIRALFVDIRSIEVATVEFGEEGAGEEWTVLEFSGGEFDILTLTNGRTQQIVDQWFPANRTITKIKLVPGDNFHFVTITDRIVPIIIPDEIRDGIIIENINANLYLHRISGIIIDIDAALSIYEVGGEFIFRPAIRAFDENFGGSLRGTVSPMEALPIVTIFKENSEIALRSFPEPNGMFMFLGLDTVNWKVQITPQESGFLDTTFVHTVTSGRNELGTIRLEIDAPEPEPDPDDDEEEDEEDDEDEENENGEGEE